MNDIIRANAKQRRKMMAMRLKGWVAVVLMACATAAPTAAQSAWDQPAAALADQVAAMMGPGQARLELHNRTMMPNDQLPALRKVLLQDLRAHSISQAGAESANIIRVTLSETDRERLLVAEVVEGSTTQVAMVRLESSGTKAAAAAGGILLRRQVVFASDGPVLAALEQDKWMVVAEPDALVLYAKSGDAWKEAARSGFVQRRGEARDPRGVVVTRSDGFEARVGGVRCEGRAGMDGDAWPVHCAESDDPWPLAAAGGTEIKGFFNAARNAYTGVITPNAGVDMPAFYSAALLPRAVGNGALLVGGVDGKVQIVENNALRAASGTRDWGSDFAVVASGCGAGVQVIASGSGAAATDSLRAYELPAREAVPVSAPLAVEGAVTTLWSAPDGKSVFAVVRDAEGRSEVDRVTALCD